MDIAAWLQDCDDLAGLTPSQMAHGMEGSAILRIAGDVGREIDRGRRVANFTVGDFAPRVFGIPPQLTERVQAEYGAGSTNYPPAGGVPVLQEAIRKLYADRLGHDYPPGCVQVGAGARPPIFAAFACLVSPGDGVVYQIPSWNVKYYVHIFGGRHLRVLTRPEDGFLMTAADLEPHLPQANLVVLNSPLNPSGTVIREDALREICEAILAENHRRETTGARPVMLLYDQVYWQLTFGDARHVTPLHVAPEMARYTVLVDAISKSWAATGVRVGWAVAPPWVINKLRPYIGHMGAWPARPEQLATATLLAEPEQLDGWLDEFREALRVRLVALHDGLAAMRDEGLPVDALDAQGAIYLTARVAIHGRSFQGKVLHTDEDVRMALLIGAGFAVVPFTAFGLPDGTGWVRLSVGAVDLDDVASALGRLRGFLRELG